MSSSESVRTGARRTRSTVLAALAVVSATLIGVLGCQSAEPSSSSAASPSATGSPSTDTRPGQPNRHGAQGEAEGAVPDGVTVFDGEIPGVAHLDPDLLRALRTAATDAADDEVAFFVNSGWRSAEYQERLLRKAVSQYGSEEEAARWVATADTSPHVSGDAVDLGRSDATKWLSQHGARYGLCQIYRNEPWHYELRPDAINGGCPRMYADPTDDPRMRQ